MRRILNDILRALLTTIHHQEIIMADFSRLNAAFSELSAKMDAFLAKPSPEPAPAPVDDQPAIDALADQAAALAAKIPS